ncbi:MAG: putative type modification methyltransferase [Bacteroidetes bacterium]|nr:putative type modification methyltransferase [Bacteroidota bacterium]
MPTLHWIGKEKIICHHLEVPYHVLEHRYGFTANGMQEENTGSGNMIIHGDNLEALKSLLPQYEGKVKCIYIDPPYNTGNEGWIYNDNVNHPKINKWLGRVVGKETDDLTRHDKWLCMMYPRLKLLRRLLDEDGVIFISINEEEQASLKIILDEVFGLTNYLTMFTIKLRHEERILKGDKDFHEVTEQLFMYRKSSKFRPHKKRYDNTSIGEYVHEVIITDDNPVIHLMDDKQVKEYAPTQFEIKKGDPQPQRLKKINIRGTLKDGNSSGRFYMKHFNSLVQAKPGHLFSVPDMGDDGTGGRFFLLPKNEKKANGDYFQGVPQNRPDVKEVPYPNYFDLTDEFNRVGYEGNVDFRFGKKPVAFLTRLFEIAGIHKQPDAIILDSFGGSGSTAHAVLQQNKADGGKRRFILIEMEHYAETITAERVKQVIRGYGKTSGTGGSFDLYELGEPLFNEDGQLNENTDPLKLKEYIWFSETRSPYKNNDSDPAYLGKHNDTAYYFLYSNTEALTLSYDTLGEHVKEKAERYVIYAGSCLLPESFMLKYNIEFKKITGDIARF